MASSAPRKHHFLFQDALPPPCLKHLPGKRAPLTLQHACLALTPRYKTPFVVLCSYLPLPSTQQPNPFV